MNFFPGHASHPLDHQDYSCGQDLNKSADKGPRNPQDPNSSDVRCYPEFAMKKSGVLKSASTSSGAGEDEEKNTGEGQTPTKIHEEVGMIATLGIFAAALSMDVGKNLSHGFVFGGEVSIARSQTLAVMIGLMSLLTSWILTAFYEGFGKFFDGGPLDYQAVIAYLPAGALFAGSQCFEMLAKKMMVGQVGLVKVVMTARIPLMFVLSTIMLGRKHTRFQFVAVGLIMMSVVCFMLLKGDKFEGGSAFGIVFALLGCVCTCLAGVFTEDLLKKGAKIPLYIQKGQIDGGQIWISILLLFLITPLMNAMDAVVQLGGGHATNAGVGASLTSYSVRVQ